MLFVADSTEQYREALCFGVLYKPELGKWI